MVIDEDNKKSVGKPSVMVDYLVNWFLGNYCAKCGMVDLDDYGDECRRKIREIAKGIGVERMRHRDFVLIMRRSLFCRPFGRKFCECKTCKVFGISNKYWIKDWSGGN